MSLLLFFPSDVLVAVTGDAAVSFGAPSLVAQGAVVQPFVAEVVMTKETIGVPQIVLAPRKQFLMGRGRVAIAVSQSHGAGSVGVGTREDAFLLGLEDLEEVA